MALTLVQASTSTLPEEVAVNRVYTLSNPAAGAEWSVTVPSGETWYVQYVHEAFLASATVATRFPLLAGLTGGAVVLVGTPAAGFAAGTSANIGYGPGLTTTSGNNDISVSIPVVALTPGSTLGSVTRGLQSGDQYSSIAITVSVYY